MTPATCSAAVTDISARRDALRRELNDARALTDRLFTLISPDAMYQRPIAERHRLIFYLGHLEAFDWNTLARRSLGEQSFLPEFDKLFERGIDPAPGQAREDSPADWPSRSEVERYGAETRVWLDDHIADLDPWALQMIIEHRFMHAETLSYLIHAMPCEAKIPPAGLSAPALRSAPANPMIEIDAATVTLGTAGDFGWDNERRSHEVSVPAFGISKFKISNGEYLRFVREGGPVPHFWASQNGRWFWRGMFSDFPLPLDWPVWVTWEQAAAYAKWRGLALPSEAQHLRAASLEKADPAQDNFDFRHWDPVAVDSGLLNSSGNESSTAPAQMTGNGWEWTRDIFAPFAGFKPDPLYPVYSSDFFDNSHYVMKGGSPQTARCLTRPGFRNWFRPDYPYVFAGFRTVGEA